MDSRDQIVVIRCFDTCVYRLVYPTFFLNRPTATLRKIFKWLFQFDWYTENEQAIEFFDRELPGITELVETQGKEKIDRAEKVWRERMADYEKDFRNPDPATFPADWTKAKKREERAARKKWNSEIFRPVRDAKANYEYTKKQVPKEIERAKVVCEVYESARNQ